MDGDSQRGYARNDATCEGEGGAFVESKVLYGCVFGCGVGGSVADGVDALLLILGGGGVNMSPDITNGGNAGS